MINLIVPVLTNSGKLICPLGLLGIVIRTAGRRKLAGGWNFAEGMLKQGRRVNKG